MMYESLDDEDETGEGKNVVEKNKKKTRMMQKEGTTMPMTMMQGMTV